MKQKNIDKFEEMEDIVTELICCDKITNPKTKLKLLDIARDLMKVEKYYYKDNMKKYEKEMKNVIEKHYDTIIKFTKFTKEGIE